MSFFGKRFYLDGERVKADQLSAEDLARVETFEEVIGGGEEDGAETKAEAPITLKVRDQAGEVMFFKVKRGTEMRKIFDAYAQRLGVNVKNLKFTLDGDRLKETDTPKMLELSDEDQIDVFLEQVGGADDAKPAGDEQPITLRVVESSGDEISFKVKKTTKMSKIFEAYASRKGVSVEMVRFMFDGNRMNAEDTPKMLEMEDNDIINVVLQQVGGL